MKKLLATIMMLTCIFALTACGSSSETLTDNEKMAYQYPAYACFALVSQEMTEEERDEVRSYTSKNWDLLSENFASSYALYVEGEVFLTGLESWWSALDEMGGMETDGFHDDYANYEVTQSSDATTVSIPVDGKERTATVEITMDAEQNVTSITVNPTYTMGEKMAKAGLNTLMGVCTVFVVLILISLVIAGFAVIPKIQDSFTKKKASTDVKSDAVDNTIAQIIEKEEDALSDDLELVAVISAAIAASEGAASTDGFVVRSIKRVGRR